MNYLKEYVNNELNNRELLEKEVLNIINDRCVTGNGRVQRGALHLYIYKKLGFYGQPGNKFAKFINKIMVNNGYRDSYLIGKRCYCGLHFKGENKKTWNAPIGKDLPIWSSNFEKFIFQN